MKKDTEFRMYSVDYYRKKRRKANEIKRNKN